jgi:hypothetical protein
MTYTDLTADIADWMHRSDLDSVIPRFVMLAEQKLNQLLRVRQMETLLPETAIVDGRITLAADIADVKTLWLPGYPDAPLRRQPFENIVARGSEGIPGMYARQGNDLVFDGGGDVVGVLFQKIPALGDTTATNWLLDEAYAVYLFGALVQSAIYTKSDAVGWQSLYDQAIADLMGQDNRYTGPLVATRAR